VLGIVVVAAAVAVGGGSAVFAGALVGALATATAWWRGGRATRQSAPLGVAIGAGAGALAAMAASTEAAGTVASWLFAVSAVGLFVLPAAVLARAPSRRALASVLWAASLFVAAVAFEIVPLIGVTAALALSSVLMVVVAALGAWCGATPWRSRVLSSACARTRTRGRTPVFLGLCSAVVLFAACGLAASLPVTQRWWAAAAVVIGVTANAMALSATRQWRLAPRARARETTILGATLGCWCGIGVLASGGRLDVALVASAVAALVVAVTGRSSLQVSDRVIERPAR
jgi:hypothetical protein